MGRGHRHRLAALVVVVGVGVAVPEASATRLVIGLREPLGPAAEQRLLAAAGTRLVRRIGPLAALQLSVADARADAAVTLLARDPSVAFALRDQAIPTPRRAVAAPSPRDVPFRHGVKVRTRHTRCAKVAVLDSGIDLTHPDLRPNLWKNPDEIPGNGVDDDHDGFVDDVYGVDLLRGAGSGEDRNGHGTHVAGIIAARANRRLGVAGVCGRAQIISVRFLGQDRIGRMSDAAAGIAYAVGKGAKIINASFGAAESSAILDRAVAYAREQGVLIVASAGNGGTDHPTYPADLPSDNIISVAALDQHDHLASFSNFGADVDLAAPGVGIPSTWPGGTYRDSSGTSMAAPFVTGAAALLRAATHAPLDRLRALLLESVDRVPGLSGRVTTGGRLDLDRALRLAARGRRG